MLLVDEDTVTHCFSYNPFAAYLDAQHRGEIAKDQHPDFFESDEHLDRLDEVLAIAKNFFGRHPDYVTPRGINLKRPFEAVKYADVGRFLTKTPAHVKNDKLYAPLLKMGNVEVNSKNGHLVIRVY